MFDVPLVLPDPSPEGGAKHDEFGLSWEDNRRVNHLFRVGYTRQVVDPCLFRWLEIGVFEGYIVGDSVITFASPVPKETTPPSAEVARV